jgi:osmoprotectant transport system substrate-binding protein
VATALTVAACSDNGSGGDGDTGGGGTTDKGEITVGVSGAFTENQLVAEMYAQVLENDGYTVTRELDIESRDVGNTSLDNGEIDLKPEYTGPDLLTYDPKADASGTPEEVAQRLADVAGEQGLVTYAISPANSSNVFVATQDVADQYSLTDISSLQPSAGDLTLGAPPDCPTNPFCAPGLKDVYGIEFADIKKLDFGGPKTVAAIDSGEVQVGVLFSLNPIISEKGYLSLEDDQQMLALGNFVPVVRQEVASSDLEAVLDPVTTSLTDDEMIEMIASVDNDREDVEDVAQQYLQGKGLL